MTDIRVAVADDHPVVLAGIKALLQGAPEIELLGDATTGKAVIESIQRTMPDIAVIDISHIVPPTDHGIRSPTEPVVGPPRSLSVGRRHPLTASIHRTRV